MDRRRFINKLLTGFCLGGLGIIPKNENKRYESCERAYTKYKVIEIVKDSIYCVHNGFTYQMAKCRTVDTNIKDKIIANFIKEITVPFLPSDQLKIGRVFIIHNRGIIYNGKYIYYKQKYLNGNFKFNWISN